MKSITPNAFIGETPRQGETLSHLRLCAMKRGVEARDLWNIRRSSTHRANSREVVWLVKWCERDQLLEFRKHALVNAHRRCELHATVNNPMADGRESLVAKPVPQSRQNNPQRRTVIDRLALQRVFFYRRPCRIAKDKSGRRSDPIDLPFRQ